MLFFERLKIILKNKINHYTKYDYLVFSTFVLATAFRFFTLPYTATWGHDNSRDVVRVLKLFKYHEIIYRGPVFSVIWGFLSPIYYYIQAPVFYLLNFNPLSPAILTLIVNLTTLFLIFYFTRKLFDKYVAYYSLLIYGLSFSVILEAAYGLNPNFCTPFTVLLFFSMVMISKTGGIKYYFWLSFSLSMLVSFHPSGFFTIIPVTVFLIWKFKDLTVKKISTLFSVFFVLALVPYSIVEKKFNFWNYNQLIKYLSGEIKSEFEVGFLEGIYNFFYVLTKNTSLVLFNSTYSIFLVLSFILFLSLIFFFYKAYLKLNQPLLILTGFILIYTLSFGLVVKFEKSSFNAWWFHPVFVPLFVIYVGYLISLLKDLNLKITYFVSIVFLTLSVLAYFRYQPPSDTYFSSKLISDIIRKDTGDKFPEIEGIDPRPIKFMNWYFEDNNERKEKYFDYVKWEDKNYDAKIVYLVLNNDSSLQEYIEKINEKYKLSTHTQIYINPVWKLYRFR